MMSKKEIVSTKDQAEVQQYREIFDMQSSPPIVLSSGELAAGFIALSLWFLLFTCGMLVDTTPHRLAIQAPHDFASSLRSWLIVVSSWTITNIGIISCISSYIGALGQRAHFTRTTNSTTQCIDASCDGENQIVTYYLSAVLRGFGVYTLVFGGIFVLATSTLGAPNQSDYMRLAPTISVMSFYAGYDPRVFAGLLDRVNGFMKLKDSRQ